MKKLLILVMITIIAGCANKIVEKEKFPYGMNEREWNELSVKDKARMRRDFYFYEKGSTALVDPNIEVEGKKEVLPMKLRQPAPRPAAEQ